MWNSEPPIRDAESLVSQLELHIDHVVQNRSNEDVLFELLIKSGFPMTTRASVHALSGKNVFSISEGMVRPVYLLRLLDALLSKLDWFLAAARGSLVDLESTPSIM